ncbi:hypothetical protein, partial [Sphingomonas sp.]|uniref:hypothetical protein n=1 Tax=Sphingomonas sp. TaxID=28214 RepID=UPI003B3B9EF7
ARPRPPARHAREQQQDRAGGERRIVADPHSRDDEGAGAGAYTLIADPARAARLRDGRETRLRVLATSALAACLAGDRIRVKEASVAGVIDAAGAECSARPRDAAFVIFADGWRQHRDGSGHAGPRPTNPRLLWTPAIHMPRWAARTILVVTGARRTRLRDIDRADILGSGVTRLAFGLLWRCPRPTPGLWRTPERAYRARWAITHPTPGERWEDDPEVVALEVMAEAAD